MRIIDRDNKSIVHAGVPEVCYWLGFELEDIVKIITFFLANKEYINARLRV